MQNSVLYTNLIDATANIIKKFGKDIIHEERFVNILSDISPGRNEPAVFKIIKSAIQDDLLKPVLNANAKRIEHQVATATAALTKQYGYDQSLVEGILFSLAIGYETITTAQYNALVALKNKPNQNTQPPSQNNNPNKPPKQKNSPNQPPAKCEATFKYVAILIWGILGLLASPVFYAYQVSANRWWPMGATIVIALIQMLTVLPVSISFGSDDSINKSRIHPALHGGYCALYMFAIAFWIVFPLFWSFDTIQAFWGFPPNTEAFPWILTWMANLFCAMLLGVALDQGVSSLSKTWRKNKGKFTANFQDLMTESPYRNGFFAVSAVFVFAAFVLYFIPLHKESQYKNKITEYNKQIEAFNHHSDSIRLARSQSERSLSFAQFELGDSYTSFVSKVKSSDEYSFSDRVSYSDYLSIQDVDYISIVDTILYVKTNWNNEDITISCYFSKHSLIALHFSPSKTDGDSILASYTAKYGEPESHLNKIESPKYEVYAYEYHIQYSMMEDHLIPEHFLWTYKNSLINIDLYKHRSYSYSIVMPEEGIHITYFDRKAEILLRHHQEEQTRKAREYQKRQNDSLRLVREAEERQRKEQRRQEELNHQRSMEQI